MKEDVRWKKVDEREHGGTDVLDEFCKGLTIFCT